MFIGLVCDLVTYRKRLSVIMDQHYLMPDANWNSCEIVIVNSRFLQRPQKRNCRHHLIHRRLIKTKSIGSGQYPESQAGRQTVRRLWWMVLGVETGREVCGRR